MSKELKEEIEQVKIIIERLKKAIKRPNSGVLASALKHELAGAKLRLTYLQKLLEHES